MEIGGLADLCVHCIWMSSYYRNHTHRLVRADPLRNLPLGYLTQSPTWHTPVDLPRFPLSVDIEPIPMANMNDINNENLERGSNQGEEAPQHRTMRDYMNPQRQTPTSAIVLPEHQATLNIKPGMLAALPQFHGFDSEQPYTHIKDFEDACSLFQDNSSPREVALLKLFPFSLYFWFPPFSPFIYLQIMVESNLGWNRAVRAH